MATPEDLKTEEDGDKKIEEGIERGLADLSKLLDDVRGSTSSGTPKPPTVTPPAPGTTTTKESDKLKSKADMTKDEREKYEKLREATLLRAKSKEKASDRVQKKLESAKTEYLSSYKTSVGKKGFGRFFKDLGHRFGLTSRDYAGKDVIERKKELFHRLDTLDRYGRLTKKSEWEKKRLALITEFQRDISKERKQAWEETKSGASKWMAGTMQNKWFKNTIGNKYVRFGITTGVVTIMTGGGALIPRVAGFFVGGTVGGGTRKLMDKLVKDEEFLNKKRANLEEQLEKKEISTGEYDILKSSIEMKLNQRKTLKGVVSMTAGILAGRGTGGLIDTPDEIVSNYTPRTPEEIVDAQQEYEKAIADSLETGDTTKIEELVRQKSAFEIIPGEARMGVGSLSPDSTATDSTPVPPSVSADSLQTDPLQSDTIIKPGMPKVESVDATQTTAPDTVAKEVPQTKTVVENGSSDDLKERAREALAKNNQGKVGTPSSEPKTNVEDVKTDEPKNQTEIKTEEVKPKIESDDDLKEKARKALGEKDTKTEEPRDSSETKTEQPKVDEKTAKQNTEKSTQETKTGDQKVNVEQTSTGALVNTEENLPSFAEGDKIAEIEVSSKGSIQSFINLKEALSEKYADVPESEIPPVAKHIMETKAITLSKEVGYFVPEDVKESHFALKGSKYMMDNGGNLFFEDIKTGERYLIMSANSEGEVGAHWHKDTEMFDAGKTVVQKWPPENFFTEDTTTTGQAFTEVDPYATTTTGDRTEILETKGDDVKTDGVENNQTTNKTVTPIAEGSLPFEKLKLEGNENISGKLKFEWNKDLGSYEVDLDKVKLSKGLPAIESYLAPGVKVEDALNNHMENVDGRTMPAAKSNFKDMFTDYQKLDMLLKSNEIPEGPARQVLEAQTGRIQESIEKAFSGNRPFDLKDITEESVQKNRSN